MKRIIVIIAIVLISPVILFAQGGTDRISRTSEYQVCNTTTIYSLPSKPADADYAIICVEGNDIRWRIKAAPTLDLGAVLSDGDCFIVDTQQEVQNFRFIQKRGGSAGGSTVYVEYERWQ